MKTIKISDKTYEKIKDQLIGNEKIDLADLNDIVGKNWFFRTVTYHMTGRVIKKIGPILQLEDAAWIADSGRFMQAIKNGTLKEVEPVGNAFLNFETVVDFFPWVHELPMLQLPSK
jgi:hypothetical protein